MENSDKIFVLIWSIVAIVYLIMLPADWPDLSIFLDHLLIVVASLGIIIQTLEIGKLEDQLN